MSLARLNRILRAGHRRAEELEPKLAALLEPILERAADEAADAFERLAVDHMAASAALRRADRDRVAQLGASRAREVLASLALTSAGPIDGVTSLSTMVCVKPRPEEADAIADPGGAPPDTLHVTLAYLGEVDGDLAPVVDALRAVAAAHPPLAGVVGGYGEFRPPGCGILLPDVPGLVELRVAVTEALVAAGVGYGRDYGFQPHMTVDGAPEDGELDLMLERAAGKPLHFDDLIVVRGDVEVVPLPLVGVPSLTAAGRGGYCLPAQLRTKTDPVRLEVVKTMTKATVEGAGLSFDVTNPFVSKALARSASQVEGISATTQRDLMRVVRASHEEGLSIPDTATAIREAMRASAPARATLIARTELAGAVNGGSLAAMQIVDAAESAAGGQGYYKQWMTAPGARYPRHELEDDLDGQTVQLDDYFDVAGFQLQHPADPDGPPEEVCNCRCTMAYTDDPGELTSSGRRRSSFHHCGDPTDVRREAAEIAASLTAAGAGGWTPPAADEMLSVDCAARPAAPGRALREGILKVPVTATSPSTAFNISEGNATRAHKIRSALGNLDHVISLPGTPDFDVLPVTMKEDASGLRGQFVALLGRPWSINVADDQEAAAVFAHEFGHLVDYSYLGKPGSFATGGAVEDRALADALGELQDAWRETDAYRELSALAESGDSFAKYMLKPEEVWARAFAQWAGRKSSGPLRREVEAMVSRDAKDVARSYSLVWQDDDFYAVEYAVENVLRTAGLLKE